jgi:hypothetical protein
VATVAIADIAVVCGFAVFCTSGDTVTCAAATTVGCLVWRETIIPASVPVMTARALTQTTSSIIALREYLITPASFRLGSHLMINPT